MTAPLVLFGAFDRHNFGDLLFPHFAAARSAPRPVLCAGLAERDFSALDGHRVLALPRLVAHWREHYGEAPLDLVHAGGEILSVDAWQAALMLRPGDEAAALIARLDADKSMRMAWARAQLGIEREAAYVLAKADLPGAGRIEFRAVGGVDLAGCAAPLRAEVAAALRQADAVSVRDRVTQVALASLGIAASLEADPVAQIAGCCAARIASRRPRLDAEGITGTYLAVQFSADYGDDATLATIAAQLDRAASARHCAVVFFRAGAAPWHDDLDVYRRCAARMKCGTTRIFASLDIWDICALLAGAGAYCGSGLHGAIVAEACGVPALSLARDASCGQGAKVAAWWMTWRPEAGQRLCPPQELAAGLASLPGAASPGPPAA